MSLTHAIYWLFVLKDTVFIYRTRLHVAQCIFISLFFFFWWWVNLASKQKIFPCPNLSLYKSINVYFAVCTRLQAWNEECPTQIILPSGRYCGKYAPSPLSHPSLTLYPYSDHSSFPELMRFIELVAPCQIKPIVHSFSGDPRIKRLRMDMSHYKSLLSLRQPVRLLDQFCSLVYSFSLLSPSPSL